MNGTTMRGPEGRERAHGMISSSSSTRLLDLPPVILKRVFSLRKMRVGRAAEHRGPESPGSIMEIGRLWDVGKRRMWKKSLTINF